MNSVNELSLHFCPYGYLDLKTACAIGDQVGFFEINIFEIIDDFKESCGFNGYEDIDPVYCILEHILQQARNVIDDELGYDFINDNTSGGTEIYTYGNYMCSSYDWSEGAKDELVANLDVAPIEAEKNIMANRFALYFLNELEIKVRE